MKEAVTGLERVRQALAIDGGHEWCDEHRRIRWWGVGSCHALVLHAAEPDRARDWCSACERFHGPMEWGDGCTDQSVTLGDIGSIKLNQPNSPESKFRGLCSALYRKLVDHRG